MRKERLRSVLLSVLILLFGARTLTAVTVTPGQGVTFNQIDYTFTGATQLNSSTARILVNVATLQAQTGLSSGFVNVATSLGWVVQNLPVFPGYPYPSISTSFNLGSSPGTPVSTLQAHVEFLPNPVTSFAGGPFTAFPVGDEKYNAGGLGGSVSVPCPPAPPIPAPFLPAGILTGSFQPAHPTLQTAMNQCVPAALATSFQWLEDTYGLKVPQPNNLGLGIDGNHDGKADDGTLVGQLDIETGRVFSSRTNGNGIPTSLQGLQGKLRYIGKSGLVNNLVLKHMGPLGGSVGQTVTDPGGNNVTVTSTSLGNLVTADALIQEVKNGEDVELLFEYACGNGHAVEVVGAGKTLGVPWVAYQSDHVQSDEDIKDGIPDNEGTAGPPDASYLIDTDGDGRLNLRDNELDANIHSFYSQSPVREVDHFPNTSAVLDLSGPFGTDRVRLTGPSTVNVAIGIHGEASDPDNDNLDQVRTELVELNLVGSSPILGTVSVMVRDVAKDPFRRSGGEIEETSNATPGILDIPPFAPSGTASSFFDVFFEVHIDGPLGSFVLHNRDQKPMRAVISHKPPAAGEGYESPDSIPLYDENGVVVAYLNAARHVPNCESVKPYCSNPPVKVNGGIQVTVQDSESGLSSVEVTELVNARIQPAISFPLGSRSPVTVTALKNDPNASSRLGLRVTDVCGNVTLCDPVFTIRTRENGKPETETVEGLAQSEGTVALFNDTPGVTTLRIEVNGQTFMAAGLKDGERRTIDISSAMLPGNSNAVRLTALGKPGGSVEVMIHE